MLQTDREREIIETKQLTKLIELVSTSLVQGGSTQLSKHPGTRKVVHKVVAQGEGRHQFEMRFAACEHSKDRQGCVRFNRICFLD